MKPLSKYYYILSFGVLLNVSAYIGILTLQSSIHVLRNIGTISAGVLYLTAAILSITLTPLLLIHIGPKWSLIIGETGFAIYTICNYIPTFASMITGAVFGAFGEALIWPAAPVYINYLLKELWKERNTSDEAKRFRSLDNERNIWLGSFYGILQNCLVWGNFISYLSLYGAKDLNVNSTQLHVDVERNVSECGAKFQLDLHDQKHLSKYVPKSESSVKLMLSLFLGMQIFSVLLHIIFLPVVSHNRGSATENRGTGIILQTLKLTLKHVRSFDQIMLIFINFYFGFLLSYSRGVFSQAFVSCTMGVQMVGLVMMIYGCANAITSLASGQIASRYTVKPLVVFGFIFDIISYIVQLLWVPNYEKRFYVIGFGAMIGASEGLWQFTVISMTALFFEEKQEIAFGATNLWCELAVFVGFIVAPTLRVNIRIFIMMAILALGCLGYAIVDNRRKNYIPPPMYRLDEMMFELAPTEFRPAAPPPTSVKNVPM